MDGRVIPSSIPGSVVDDCESWETTYQLEPQCSYWKNGDNTTCGKNWLNGPQSHFLQDTCRYFLAFLCK